MKTTTVHEKLGLTMSEVAMLLGVGTSHYSMFESGKRSLPLHAQKKLAELLMAANQSTARSNPSNTTDYLTSIITKRLDENNYFQALTERKIATLERHKTKASGLQSIASVFSNGNAERESIPPVVERKVKKAEAIDYDQKLVELHFKLEWLAHERAFLESRLAARS